ncbi:hypothetical protein B0H17DRAFT_119057 [Mycena rosella]|uniref:Uncharacterized protein n=1 Tax=Mycena rosella TaxID=1033263 RepID=A0AAD7DZ69_MYCRO|nr:hypothetical protein B0H17DRAFT_119057 [Mycena rosella]
MSSFNFNNYIRRVRWIVSPPISTSLILVEIREISLVEGSKLPVRPGITRGARFFPYSSPCKSRSSVARGSLVLPPGIHQCVPSSHPLSIFYFTISRRLLPPSIISDKRFPRCRTGIVTSPGLQCPLTGWALFCRSFFLPALCDGVYLPISRPFCVRLPPSIISDTPFTGVPFPFLPFLSPILISWAMAMAMGPPSLKRVPRGTPSGLVDHSDP